MATLVSKDPGTGREVFSGYSWTTLLFGPLPALFRQDWVGALIGLGIVLGLLVVTASMDALSGQVIALVAWAIWAGVYNASHASRVTKS